MGILDFQSMPDDNSETVRKLQEELLQLNERNQDLANQLKTAKEAQLSAEARLREKEDLLHFKEQMCEDTEKQLALAQVKLEEFSTKLSAQDRELSHLYEESNNLPISDFSLLSKFQHLRQTFETISNALTCPICYERFGKGQAVSLMCGHAYCEDCYATWETRAIAQFKASPQQGRFEGVDCPECRSKTVQRGRVRIWVLEEIVRIVEKASREAELGYIPPTAVDAAPGDKFAPPSRANDFQPESEFLDLTQTSDGIDSEMDEAAASILRPRAPRLYVRVFR